MYKDKRSNLVETIVPPERTFSLSAELIKSKLHSKLGSKGLNKLFF